MRTEGMKRMTAAPRGRAALAGVAAVVIGVTAAACGGSAAANGTTAHGSVATTGGSTSAGGAVGNHVFSTRIGSVGSIVNRVSKLSSSSGGSALASALGSIRTQLAGARARLAQVQAPSSLETPKERLMGFLDQWQSDLARAQQQASQGNVQKAISTARSSTYTDVQNLVASVQSSLGTG